jgi:hypothetical protein
MPFIYQKDELVSDAPQDETWKRWAVSDEYHARLIHGERPLSWEQLLLPDRTKFHELISGSELWFHCLANAPGSIGMLTSALMGSSTLNQAVLLENIKDMMGAVVAELGTDNALHSAPSSKTVNDPNDPEALPIPIGSLADELDSILAESFFAWRYADLTP